MSTKETAVPAGQAEISGFDEGVPRRLPPMRVIRSPRRKSTASARLKDGILELRIPASFSKDQEQAMVSKLLAKFEEKWRSSQVNLEPRRGSSQHASASRSLARSAGRHASGCGGAPVPRHPETSGSQPG